PSKVRNLVFSRVKVIDCLSDPQAPGKESARSHQRSNPDRRRAGRSGIVAPLPEAAAECLRSKGNSIPTQAARRRIQRRDVEKMFRASLWHGGIRRKRGAEV